MSKNITIAEGSQAKNFNTVHKLRTNLIGGGTQYWVPEDEAGAYAKLSEKSITSNGTYNASDDDKDGFSKVIVNIPPTRPNLKSKSITENGTYRAIDDEADGYSTVTVNVRNGGEGEFVTGVDPEDGNEYEVTVDEKTKELKKELMPSYIALDYPPGKLRYNDGESLLKIGMVAKAYSADGVLWRNSTWPSDSIPNDEITLVPNKADSSKALDSGINYDLDISPMAYPIRAIDYNNRSQFISVYVARQEEDDELAIPEVHMDWQVGSWFYRMTGVAYEYQGADGWRLGLFIVAAGTQEQDAVLIIDRINNTRTRVDGIKYPSKYVDDLYVYSFGATYYLQDRLGGGWAPYNTQADFNYGGKTDEFYTALAYGRRELLYEEISAQWKRPDNKILKTSYQIEIPTFVGE